MARMTPGLGKPIEVRQGVSSVSTYPAPDVDLLQPRLNLSDAKVSEPSRVKVAPAERPPKVNALLAFNAEGGKQLTALPVTDFRFEGDRPARTATKFMVEGVTSGKVSLAAAKLIQQAKIKAVDGSNTVDVSLTDMRRAYKDVWKSNWDAAAAGQAPETFAARRAVVAAHLFALKPGQ